MSGGRDTYCKHGKRVEMNHDADVARSNGWVVGTRLAGDEGYGETVIEITAIGESKILAKRVSHRGVNTHDGEHVWTLSCREWREVKGDTP